MAERTNADSRQLLVISPPPQIPKDMPGSDNSIPLSPQWLLSKPGESKPGLVSGDPHLSSNPGHASRSDVGKLSGNGEDFHDTEKKRDVFRPSLHDAESGRRDRWRDEERDANLAIRRDRWREGDKDHGDTRKMERWTDNSSARHAGEGRRVPSDRWTDSGNRESSYDSRRESKWNTRWGPDDKESESWREKWLDSGRDGEGIRDKGITPVTNHAKDTEREGDHYSRSWRSNSSQSRGWGEVPNHQTLTPNKQAPMFGYGRGRLENASSTFSAGRGRVNASVNTANSNSSHPSVGAVLDKSEGAHGDPSNLRYSRTKLLDVYRITDVRGFQKLLDGFIEVPSLTEVEPLEPLALSAPTPEEVVILKGIDKGEIVSSGAPQVSKEGSVGRNSTDIAQLRRNKLGSREDLPSGMDDYKDDSADNSKVDHFNYSENALCEKDLHSYGPDSKGEAFQNHHDNKFSVEAAREVHMQETSSARPGIPWRSQAVGERLRGSSLDWQENSGELRSRASDMGWSQSRDYSVEWEKNMTVPLSQYKGEQKWQVGEGFPSDINWDSNIKRQSSEVLDREREANAMLGRGDSFISRDRGENRKILLQASPEDLSLYYKDPQGDIQGPFSGSDLIGWFEAGYFGIDLQVCLASASHDTPFSSLGDVMPHLRMKARPPPGFGGPKPNDTAEASGRTNFSSIGKLHTGLSNSEFVKSEQRNKNESTSEAENRFLESLMSGNVGNSALDAFAHTEGVQGYVGSAARSLPTVGVESGSDLNYLLAQRMSLEHQRSLPNPLQYWPSRDTAPMVPKAEIVSDSSAPHSKLLQSMAEGAHQFPQSPQHVDLRSILQVAADKSSSPSVNSGGVPWSNIADVRSLSNAIQGGMDVVQDKMDIHHNQQFSSQAGYGIQQQRLQSQQPPSLPHMINPPVDHPSGIVSPEKLLSSGIPQDPQMLNILQQQYLLSQLHPQAPVPMQLSLLDKLLLLQRQQKQEQQQQLLLQQQHLLSQVLSEHQPHQHFVEPSFGHLQTAVTAGNASLDHLGLQQPQEVFHINSQMPQQNIPLSHENHVQESVHNLQDDQRPNLANSTLQVSCEVGYNVGSEALDIHLPRHIFENAAHPKSWAGTQQMEDSSNSQVPTMANQLPSSDVLEKPLSENSVSQKQVIFPEDQEVGHEYAPQNAAEASETVPFHCSDTSSFLSPEEGTVSPAGTNKNDTLIPEKANDIKVPSAAIVEESEVQKEQHDAEHPAILVKSVEVKKPSEKKSKKQKNSKAQSSLDQGKGASKTTHCQQPKHDNEIEGTHDGDRKSETNVEVDVICGASSVRSSDYKTGVSAAETVTSAVEVETGDGKVDSREVECGLQQKLQASTGHRAWKPAPGLKPKSLLEIQQEEQRRVQTEMAVSEISTMVIPVSSSSTAPWAGVVANSEPKTTKDIHQDSRNSQFVTRSSEDGLNPKSKKSPLHDLLAEEVLAKADLEVPTSSDRGSSLPPLPVMAAQVDVVATDDDNFVEAKDTKKGRKKAAKNKGSGVKASPPVASVDLSTSPVPIEKGKPSRQAQQEKELLLAPPSGPSLADFVLWKGDQTNSVPAPAWSTDSGRGSKPISLRDIQKEQEKKSSTQHQNPMPTPTKVQPNRTARGNGSSWPQSGTSPSKAASPIQISSHNSSQLKSKSEDDLFWGPLDQSKQEAKQSDFPSLANPSSWGSKGAPTKGISGGSLNRQKSSSGRPAEQSLSSSPASSFKGRRDAMTKHTEAMDFRDWCESESIRLTGTKDTSFLEFCLKQSTSEAQMLLIENLGSFDPNHEFIDKFLNYKELLSADVIDIAFQPQNERRVSGFGIDNVNIDSTEGGDHDPEAVMGVDGSSRGGGKKKGKKGKKVSPSVLGFNVVSTRIMMGEIQTVED